MAEAVLLEQGGAQAASIAGLEELGGQEEPHGAERSAEPRRRQEHEAERGLGDERELQPLRPTPQPDQLGHRRDLGGGHGQAWSAS